MRWVVLRLLSVFVVSSGCASNIAAPNEHKLDETSACGGEGQRCCEIPDAGPPTCEVDQQLQCDDQSTCRRSRCYELARLSLHKIEIFGDGKDAKGGWLDSATDDPEYFITVHSGSSSTDVGYARAAASSGERVVVLGPDHSLPGLEVKPDQPLRFEVMDFDSRVLPSDSAGELSIAFPGMPLENHRYTFERRSMTGNIMLRIEATATCYDDDFRDLSEWECERERWRDGVCDCGCGIEDIDCTYGASQSRNCESPTPGPCAEASVGDACTLAGGGTGVCASGGIGLGCFENTGSAPCRASVCEGSDCCTTDTCRSNTTCGAPGPSQPYAVCYAGPALNDGDACTSTAGSGTCSSGVCQVP